MFYGSLFFILPFFFLPLFCLPFFDLRLLITPLWYLQTFLMVISKLLSRISGVIVNVLPKTYNIWYLLLLW